MSESHSDKNSLDLFPVTIAELQETTAQSKRPPWILTWPEVKLYGIVGVGHFLDSYDLFIINPVATMLQYRLYGGNPLPSNLEGLMKAAGNIGNVIGQVGFGYLGDKFGRKAIYGKELMLIILATILTMAAPTGTLPPSGSLIYIAIFRIMMGVGIGGDYPMSASIASERSTVKRRGTFLAYLVSNQGWGNFAGGLATVIILAAYKHSMNDEGHISKVDGAWRIAVGLSLIPACGTLYQRLTLSESRRFVQSHKLKTLLSKPVNDHGVTGGIRNPSEEGSSEDRKDIEDESLHPIEEPAHLQRANVKELIQYFSEWRHAKQLICTSACWFLVDVAFYGVNLNQNFVLQQIGFDGSEGTPWHRLFKISTGSIIITALGLIPGYYATILTIEKLGRKWLQIQGCMMSALFLGILAGKFHTLSKPAFVVCFALLQFFFNFGANMTIYIIPAELYPTRYRASAHGISAAAGKSGAIISALAFNTLSKHAGTPAVLWIFFGCCIAGIVFTLPLPEVKGRDADVIFLNEINEKRKLEYSKASSQ